jgi:tetratricopeptide (TPR) repeat protein
VFPIFPVDYPFIEKGHSFIMDSDKRARTKRTNSYARNPTSSGVGARHAVSLLRSHPIHLRKSWMALGLQTLAAMLFLTCPALLSVAQLPPRKTQTEPAKNVTAPPAAHKAHSNDVQQLLAAGQAAQEQGRFEEAVRTYNRVIALSANQPRTSATAHFRIGNVYMAQGKFGNAEVAFQRAISLNPSEAESYNNLGEALGELKQYPRALEAFTKAINLDQKLLKAKYNQAVSYDRMGNFRYSEFVFRSLIKNNPRYSLAFDGLAVTLSKAGRAKEAIAFHEQAIALDPREPSYYYNYAISYLMMGNTAKAIEQRDKLKTLDPAIADRLASVIVKHQM